MALDESKKALWAKMQADADNKRTPQQEEWALKGGDGGGTSGGMEARVARLESDMEHVKKSVDRIDAGISDLKKSLADLRVETAKAGGEVKGSLSAIEERTKHFPTRWETFLVFSVLVAVLAGAVRLLT